MFDILAFMVKITPLYDQIYVKSAQIVKKTHITYIM